MEDSGVAHRFLLTLPLLFGLLCLSFQATVESLLGYTSLVRDADTPRSLRVCVTAEAGVRHSHHSKQLVRAHNHRFNASRSVDGRGGKNLLMHTQQHYYHHLDALCADGDVQVSHLGFVY